MKKNFFLHFSLRYKIFYKLYLFYNLYIRNLKYYNKKSYSQFEEDLFIKNFFKDKKKGFFVDIGCHHPFKGNNTFLLYKLGWSGINIDLNKLSIDLFNVARPRDINICTAISEKEGEIEYFLPNNNPLSSEITINKKFSNILKKHHGNQYKPYRTKSVTWNSIKDKYNNYLKEVDFFKIDIEGSDFQVLRNIDLTNLKIKLIMIEASHLDIQNRNEIINYLKLKNYKIVFDNNLNVIFENEKFY